MPEIQQLSSHLIDRIAAGEVIERPASVVKELLENAIDAGASAVEVELQEGGLRMLAVSDNGRGMDREDALLCIARHATSKLKCADDLFAIYTMGFRGEALSSIAAVSRLTLTTRRAQDVSATRLVVEGGEVLRVDEIGAPVGTSIVVRDLFYNTPARRKFMRAPATEQRHIVDAAMRVLLGARGCGLLVRAGSRRLVDVPDALDDERRVQAALGQRVGPLHAVHGRMDAAIEVRGFVAEPEAARRDSKGLWLFVNGRFVRDRTVQRAVLDAYHGLLERGRIPVVVLDVRLPPDQVDVNVHPQKLEVRFADGNSIYRAVNGAVGAALAETPWSGPVAADRVRDALARYYVRARGEQADYVAAGPATSAAVAPPQQLAVPVQPAALAASGEGQRGGRYSRLSVLGFVSERFLICQDGAALVVLDALWGARFAALQQLRAQLAQGRVPGAPLLLPLAIDLSGAQLAWLGEHWERLAHYGFEIEPVGPQRFAVRSLPLSLPVDGAHIERVARQVIEFVTALDASRLGEEIDALLVALCATLEVGGAGSAASPEDARDLLRALDAVDETARPASYAPFARTLVGEELVALLRVGSAR